MTNEELLKRCREWFNAYMHDRESHDEAAVLLAAIDAVEPSSATEPFDREQATERLANAVEAYMALEKKTPKELVDLMLGELDGMDLNTTQELLIEELCSRVHPNWPKEVDESKERCRSGLGHQGEFLTETQCTLWEGHTGPHLYASDPRVQVSRT